MKRYLDLNNDSGIAAYDYGKDWIRVNFTRGGTYEYLEAVIGPVHLSNMKRLADAGDGLNAYINTTPVVRAGGSKLAAA